MDANWANYVGYAASFFVVLSFMVKNIKQIRVINLIGLMIDRPVFIYYRFYEKNKRRDLDNISGFAHKVIQDALVKNGILENDGWANITGFDDNFFIDKEHPRIELTIHEVRDVRE